MSSDAPFYRYSNSETRDLAWEEACAREAEELGPQCAGCGRHCGDNHRDVTPDESYCGACSVRLAAFIAAGAVPHGSDLNDPDSLTVVTGRWA